jgi:hypothetical protein
MSSFGCLFSPPDLRDFRVASSNTNIELPKEYKLNAGTVKNQGVVNSCVAHSLSTIMEMEYNPVFSTGWIYGYRPDDYYMGCGMYPREALKTLLNKGAVVNSEFPYNIEMYDAKEKVDNDLERLEGLADRYRISSFARLYTVDEIKNWIYSKETPILVAIATSGIKLDENNIIQIPEKYPMLGHALTVIGWNETGFIVQNSWGDLWGDKGFAILPYEYNIVEAWGVTFTDYHRRVDVKQPRFNLVRKLLMSLYKLVRRFI